MIKQIPLGSLCEITSSKRIFAEEYVEDGIPFYRSKEIIEKNNNQTISDSLFISPSRFEDIKKRFGIPVSGDILLTSVGTLGVPYRVKDTDYFYFKDGNLTWMKDFSDNLDSQYLYYWLSSSFGKQSLIQKAIGSSQPALTIEILKKYKLLVPPLATQQKIASILSAYDSLIENNQKRIKLLEQMAENLYKEWFVRFRFPGYENAEFEGGVPKGWNSQAGHNRKPKGWEYGELRNLGSFARGKNITSSEMIEGDVPVISAGLEPSGYHNATNVSGPCLTISSSGANAGYLKYNLTDIWAADCSYYNNLDNIWFVYSALKYLQPVISNMQCGSAQPHVYPKDVNRLCVVLAPTSLVKMFNKQCKVIFDEIFNLNNQIKLLTRQRDLLLPRLMSGKLEVNALKGQHYKTQRQRLGEWEIKT